MRFNQARIVTSGDMGASVLSAGIDMQQLALGSVQAVWTGSPVGDFTIEISNDIVQVASGSDPSANVVNWITYTGSTQAAGGDVGKFMWEIGDIGSRWIRLKYTRTSGTGVLDGVYFGKGP